MSSHYSPEFIVELNSLPEDALKVPGVRKSRDVAFIPAHKGEGNRIIPEIDLTDIVIKMPQLSYIRSEGPRHAYTILIVDGEGRIRRPIYVGRNGDGHRQEKIIVRTKGDIDYALFVHKEGTVSIHNPTIYFEGGQYWYRRTKIYEDNLPLHLGIDIVRSALPDKLKIYAEAIMTAYEMVTDVQDRWMETMQRTQQAEERNKEDKRSNKVVPIDKAAAGGEKG